MLFNILSSQGTMAEKILYLLISVLALLPALTFHEWAHGYAAYKLGDSTAKADGRLSLNPLDHIDPMGSLMMLIIGFGWAKPVPVNTRYFKKPKRDFALTSLAGPIANFVLGFVSGLLYVLSIFLVNKFGVTGVIADLVPTLFMYSMLMNVGLGTFNLIPLPPLDGSNVLMCILPNHIAAKYAKFKTFVEKIGVSILVPEIKIATTNKMIEISAANKAVMQAHAKACGRSRFVYMLYAMLKSLSRFKFGKIDV